MAYTTIKKPSDYFNTKLYSGTGSSQAVTGVGFQPDWIWFKCRQANNHNWFDVIRGSNKIIQSSTANVEATSAALLTSFDSDGFTVNTDDGVNGSGKTYASWNWLANGTGVANTDGSISSTVSANTTSGFSIVSYTGTGSNSTIGHGLGSAPQVVLIKELNGTNNWIMSHQPLSASLGDYTRFMTLNSTSAVSGAGNVLFQSSAFTSSVFNVGTSAATNGSGQNFIAYCFAEKQGYSKFGSYTGTGNADGPFNYTGFKPAFLIWKRTDVANDWYVVDNKRDAFNEVDANLFPNLSAAESIGNGYNGVDFLSNGFKVRQANSSINASGGTFIYMAFAEQPLVGDNPATAR